MIIGRIVFVLVTLSSVAVFFGCATQVAPTVTDPITAHHDTTVIEKPVPVPCLAESDVPPLPTETVIDPDNSTIKQKVAALLLDLQAYVRYAELSYRLMKKCSVLSQ